MEALAFIKLINISVLMFYILLLIPLIRFMGMVIILWSILKVNPNAILELMKERKYETIVLFADTISLNFYLKNGFIEFKKKSKML